MKKVFSLIAVLALSISVFACDLQDLMTGNTTLAKKIRQFEKQGFTVVEGDQTFYSQYRYFAAPVAPYTDGSGQVTLVKSVGNYSLETTYVTISFTGQVTVQNKCVTSITDVTTQTIY